MVTFELFARPIWEALAGMPPQKLTFLHARLKSDIKTKTGLTRFLRQHCPENSNTEVELARWQGSGDVASMTRANCYIVISPDRERIQAGEWVPADALMWARAPALVLVLKITTDHVGADALVRPAERSSAISSPGKPLSSCTRPGR